MKLLRSAVMVMVWCGGASAFADSVEPLDGLTQQAQVAPRRGFIDDVVALDGRRLAYLETDGATFSDLVVRQGDAEVLRVARDGGSTPYLLALLPEDQVLVASRGQDDAALAEIHDRTGKVAKRFGPGNDVAFITRDQRKVISVHKVAATASGHRHTVEIFDPTTGKRLGKPATFDLDAQGRHLALDFKVNHWLDGHTLAVGTKGGHWDKKENQRTVDSYATYDVVAKKFVAEEGIGNLREHVIRLGELAAAKTPEFFARINGDLSTVELWRGARHMLTLDQPLDLYQPRSLSAALDDRGTAWIGLSIDPTNPGAVSRKSADLEYFDLFVITDDKATRRARIRSPKKRFHWGVAAGLLWTLERNAAIERGGKALTIYRL